MKQSIRYGDAQREAARRVEQISYNALVPRAPRDAAGQPIPCELPPIQLGALDIYRLLRQYVNGRFLEQLKAVVPLALYLVVFQLLVLNQVVQDAWVITCGLLAVIIGLMFFMEGLKLGLMPFGEAIGSTLPRKSTLPVVLLVAFMLGVGVTFAEPAIGALKTAGQIVSVDAAPYLYALLNDWSGTLVLIVGAGVGLAVVLGTLRFLYGWSLKPMIYGALVPALSLSAYAAAHPELNKVLGLAWDCGAVTTGPVTVPLVLSLGIGIAAAGGKGGETLSGFGIVTLASLFPIIGVLGLSVYLAWTVDPGDIIAAAHSAAAVAASNESAWYQRTPGQEVVLGIRAILPLVLFLYVVLRLLLGERLENGRLVAYGIGLTIAGMVIFNLGLTYGLSKLGGQSGGLLPGAFTQIDAIPKSPLYLYIIGMSLALAFAWFLGFGATLAEPALNALGATVENLTQGVFKKSTLMYAVSLGVACGIATGLAKIVFDWPLAWILFPTYLFAALLTLFSTEEYVNIAWDSAGVTTGPITVPLVLAMGLGVGGAVNVVEGFGMLSMASIGPIISVLLTGLWVRLRTHRRMQAVAESA